MRWRKFLVSFAIFGVIGLALVYWTVTAIPPVLR
jgi:hypothetical protein